MVWCVAFEAKSIQPYILASNKLRDMVGASALVDELVEKPLGALLAALGLKEDEDVRFSRRAGGAFMAFLDDGESAQALAEAWSLIVPRYAPGLSFVLTRQEGEHALAAAKQALAALAASRFPQPRLPAATPITRLAPRTGEPAVDVLRTPEGKEWADAAVVRKRARGKAERLERKFLGENPGRFPMDMENEFPFVGDNRYVGIVHADGNGLGQMLMSLQRAAEKTPSKFVGLYSRFSRELALATEKAARRATQEVIAPHPNDRGFLPMRPLVLGGDDLTCIVRGDLALEFVQAFLAAFEEETKGLCAWLAEETDWQQPHLTACAGIAYVKAHQPFALGYALAEALCKQAKDASKRAHSAVAFHRVTTSFVPDADWVRTQEMRREAGGKRITTTLGAYGLHKGGPLPALAALVAFARVLAAPEERAGASAMRRLLSLAGEAPGEAERLYARWRELLGKENARLLREFDEALAALLQGEPAPRLPAREVAAGHYETPLGDVLALQAVGDALCHSEEADRVRAAA